MWKKLTNNKKDGHFLWDFDKSKDYKIMVNIFDVRFNIVKQSDFYKIGYTIENACPDCLRVQNNRYQRNLVVV